MSTVYMSQAHIIWRTLAAQIQAWSISIVSDLVQHSKVTTLFFWCPARAKEKLLDTSYQMLSQNTSHVSNEEVISYEKSETDFSVLSSLFKEGSKN